MSSTDRAENTTYFLEFNNPGYNDDEETFTDLHSCRDADDNDSQCSYSNSSGQNQSHTHLNTSTIVSPLESSNEIINLIREDLYKYVFMPMSKQINNDFIRCCIRRQNYDIFQTFQLEIECGDNRPSFCLLTAEKQSHIAAPTHYSISVIPNFTTVSYSVKLQSDNILGTSYSLYHVNEDKHERLAAIVYETNFLGLKGPRKIESLLPKFNIQLEALFDENELDELGSSDPNDSFIHLHTKPPDCNPDTSVYSLNFDGRYRGIVASVKNFQMILRTKDKEQLIMQFGRMSHNEFFCDFRYPLSLIQAFGIALSAFDSRLFRD